MVKVKPQSVDEYISEFPKEVAEKLEQIRNTIRKAAPGAEETISYNMPTFKMNGGSLIYFAGWKKHIALYPVSAKLVGSLEAVLAGYKGSKDSVHFSLDKPVPLDLVRQIVEFRLKEK